MNRHLVLICLLANLAWAPLRADNADVVAIDDGHPATATATPTPLPSATQTPTDEPTLPPTATPEPAPQAAAQPSPAAADGAAVKASAENLGEPIFDKSGKRLMGEGDEGLVIIAPGAASPEDAFESFGIDSPYNWRERQKKTIGGAGAAAEGAGPGDESIQLNAPETSDFKEKVAVENSQGQEIQDSGGYDVVERAGMVEPEAEFPMDGTILREKNNKAVFGEGSIFFMSVEPGRQVYPGSIYSIYRDMGKVQSGGDDPQDMGKLLRAVGVAQVVRVDSENTIARVEKQYDAVRVGDGVRLRDPDKTRYFESLRQATGVAPVSDIKGNIVGVQYMQSTAVKGSFVYLDVGKSGGALPGVRLSVYRSTDMSGDMFNDKPGSVGKLGEIEVLSVQRESSTARVIKADGGMAVGDQIRYR